MKNLMQIATAKFTRHDLAKYPFLKGTIEYVKKLDLKIEDLTKPEFALILERAEERVEEAILYALVSRKLQNEEIEILSFPVAIMLAVATENSFIKKRYALAEAKQAYNDMKLEPKERILAIAQNFGWKIAVNNDVNVPYEFKLHFTDYLKNTTQLREKKWKLANRLLLSGDVYLTRNETARLLSEEVRRYIEKRLEIKESPKFPPEIMEKAEKIKILSTEKIGKTEMEGFPKKVVQTAFPPCIKTLYRAISSGHHISHIGRFTLTSFLINVGMPSENLIELFKNFSDYNERMTRYQVEHIAGERGSRTRYMPPRCDTLKTHSVCINPDVLCQNIRHPLAYYRRKIKSSNYASESNSEK
ncbi:MAG: DNA primase large subunit PriL [Candidatus Bathyarchaeia archaeon]